MSNALFPAPDGPIRRIFSDGRDSSEAMRNITPNLREGDHRKGARKVGK